MGFSEFTCPKCGSLLGDLEMDDSVSCPRCGLSAEALRKLIRPLMETRGELVCFEICKGNLNATTRLGFGPGARYLMTSVYTVDGANLGLQSFQWHGASCTISELVDKYIKDSPSVVFVRKIPYPVRNMPYGHPVLGYEPLNEEEMVEFQRLLLSRDPERYALSFSNEVISGICRKHRCRLEERMIGSETGDNNPSFVDVCPRCEEERRDNLEQTVERIRKYIGRIITVEITERGSLVVAGSSESSSKVSSNTGVLEKVGDYLSSVTITGNTFLPFVAGSGSGTASAGNWARIITAIKCGEEVLYQND